MEEEFINGHPNPKLLIQGLTGARGSKMDGYNRSMQYGDLKGAVDKAKKGRVGSSSKAKKAALIGAGLLVTGGLIGGGVAIANDAEEQVVATEQRLEMILDTEAGTLVGIDEIDTLERTMFNGGFNPYFKAHRDSPTGSLVPIEGALVEIVKKNGTAWLRMESPAGEDLYVHPTAIVSASYGEHPAEKFLRLADEHNLDINRSLKRALSNEDKRDALFHNVTFDYQPGKGTTQVISEFLMDNTVITMVDPVPKEWRAPNEKFLTPLLFEVQPSILDDKTMDQLKFHTGHSFNSDIFKGSNLQERLINFTTNKRMGVSVDSRIWMVDVLRELELPLEDNVKSVGLFLMADRDFFFTTTNGTYDTTEGNFYRLTPEDEVIKLATARGRFLTALPFASDNNRVLISAEGYDEKDPRHSSIYELNLTTGEVKVIEFPEKSRAGGELFATGPVFTPDSEFLFLKRYGFHDEGGGMWVLDMNDPEYKTSRKIVQWDHMLGFTTFGYLQRYPTGEGSDESPVVAPIAMNGKEVEDSFAMTVNHGWLTIDGMDTSLDFERVGIMVGWNPMMTYYERTDDSIRVFTTISYNYESFMDSFPFAIYRTIIDLEGDGEFDLTEMPLERGYLEVQEPPSE